MHSSNDAFHCKFHSGFFNIVNKTLYCINVKLNKTEEDNTLNEIVHAVETVMIFNKLITDQIAVIPMQFVYPENQFKLCRNNRKPQKHTGT